MYVVSSSRRGQNGRMSDQPPAFQFYAKDWLASSAVRRMTLAERGAYIDLLAYAWKDGSIPNDSRSLVSMLGVATRTWKSVAPAVLARFTEGPNGTLVNERQETVRNQLLAFSERQSKAGKAGAEKRWGRHVPATRGAIERPMARNSSASASADVRTRTSTHTVPIGSRSEHAGHAACGRVCVPEKLHSEFERMASPGFDVREWYGEIDDEWHANGQPIGDDPFSFWRRRWKERFGATYGTTQPTHHPLDDESHRQVWKCLKCGTVQEENHDTPWLCSSCGANKDDIDAGGDP